MRSASRECPRTTDDRGFVVWLVAVAVAMLTMPGAEAADLAPADPSSTCAYDISIGDQPIAYTEPRRGPPAPSVLPGTSAERPVCYDETAIRGRSLLSRKQKTAFAAACAQRLLPLFERYVAAVGDEGARELAGVVNSIWRAVAGDCVDLAPAQATAEALVPSDDGEWFYEMAYGQNGAASAAYAVRRWLTDDPQETAWAARQVYEAADYAAQRLRPDLDLNAADAE